MSLKRGRREAKSAPTRTANFFLPFIYPTDGVAEMYIAYFQSCQLPRESGGRPSAGRPAGGLQPGFGVQEQPSGGLCGDTKSWPEAFSQDLVSRHKTPRPSHRAQATAHMRTSDRAHETIRGLWPAQQAAAVAGTAEPGLCPALPKPWLVPGTAGRGCGRHSRHELWPAQQAWLCPAQLGRGCGRHSRPWAVPGAAGRGCGRHSRCGLQPAQQAWAG